MGWVTIIWVAAAAVSLTLGGIHMVVWCQNRKHLANLWFHLATVSVAGIALFELGLMHSKSTEEYGTLHQWGHVPVFSALLLFSGFILFYFRAGRWWLALLLALLRVAILVLNFAIPPTFNYSAITALVPVRFLGETITLAKTVESPWARLGEFSLLLFVAFMVDASISLWRRGGQDNRRRAIVVGSSFGFYLLVVCVNVWLVHTGRAHVPYIISLCFLVIVISMGYELSRDVIHAARMAFELREYASSVSMAADAAQLALWRWDISSDAIWVSPNGRKIYGIPEKAPVTLQRFIDALHPEDREAARNAVMLSLESDGAFRTEYRAVLPDGQVRWIGARGHVEFAAERKPVCIRGVSLDITERKNVENEAAQHRSELAHLTRVTTLSELSGSLAHELNQPLAIILSNAQAAQRLLNKTPLNMEELREILADIVYEDQRAGEVIKRLRALLKRGETTLLPLALNDAVAEALHLASTDLIGRGVKVKRNLAPDLPLVSGDAIQLQQVILNLVLNGADAMTDSGIGERILHVSTAQHGGVIRFSLRDEGIGLPADIEQLFEPFHTTKPQGLGMGLSISRSILTAHHGRLWAESHAEKGAVFHFELPAYAVPAPTRREESGSSGHRFTSSWTEK